MSLRFFSSITLNNTFVYVTISAHRLSASRDMMEVGRYAAYFGYEKAAVRGVSKIPQLQRKSAWSWWANINRPVLVNEDPEQHMTGFSFILIWFLYAFFLLPRLCRERLDWCGCKKPRSISQSSQVSCPVACVFWYKSSYSLHQPSSGSMAEWLKTNCRPWLITILWVIASIEQSLLAAGNRIPRKIIISAKCLWRGWHFVLSIYFQYFQFSLIIGSRLSPLVSTKMDRWPLWIGRPIRGPRWRSMSNLTDWFRERGKHTKLVVNYMY